MRVLRDTKLDWLQKLDFAETYSHMIKPITIRIVLAIVVSTRWYVHLIDASNAFLHGFLQEDVLHASTSRVCAS